LVCAHRTGVDIRHFNAITRVLRQQAHEAGMTSSDLGAKLSPENLAELFDVEDLSVLEPGMNGEIGVVLAVLYDVDPAKSAVSGQPTVDTVVRYMVLDTGQKKVVDRGQFKEMTGRQSPDRMATRCADILIRRYLVPHSPAIGTAEISP
jgi:hypothetical protein